MNKYFENKYNNFRSRELINNILTLKYTRKLKKRCLSIERNWDSIREEFNGRNSKIILLSSLGRVGTKSLDFWLRDNFDYNSYHSYSPELLGLDYLAQINFMYEFLNKNNQDKNELFHMFFGSRYERLFLHYVLNLVYFESNYRVTYFSDQVLDKFPNSKIIFIRSNLLQYLSSSLRIGSYDNIYTAISRIKLSDAIDVLKKSCDHFIVDCHFDNWEKIYRIIASWVIFQEYEHSLKKRYSERVYIFNRSEIFNKKSEFYSILIELLELENKTPVLGNIPHTNIKFQKIENFVPKKVLPLIEFLQDKYEADLSR